MNVLLEQLFRTDLQGSSEKRKFLETIEKDQKENKGYREYISNIFNIDIYYIENKIKIGEDVDLTGEGEVILTIPEFIEELKKKL